MPFGGGGIRKGLHPEGLFSWNPFCVHSPIPRSRYHEHAVGPRCLGNNDYSEIVLSFGVSKGTMEVLREFLESSTIHGLNHISTAKVFNRPGVAGAVLQTPSSLID